MYKGKLSTVIHISSTDSAIDSDMSQLYNNQLSSHEELAVDNSFIINRSTVANDWHDRGFSCGMWIDHAGREWSYEAQDTDELFMLMSGELELEMKGQLICPLVGEEIRILTGNAHTIRNIGKQTARWLYGQRRETTSQPQPSQTVQERTFHPELKRKRRPEKRTPAIHISKDV